jgi:hypothetical protein
MMQARTYPALNLTSLTRLQSRTRFLVKPQLLTRV